MSKKILLVRPPSSSSLDFGCSMKQSTGGHEIELGLLYIAACLEKNGHQVRLLDMSLYEDGFERLEAILKDHSFDFIGLTAYTNFITTANKVAGFIRRFSQAKIVVGGAHASALPAETLKEFENFDYLVYGEGEVTFLELMAKDPAEINGLVHKKAGEIIVNPSRELIKNLDSLPFPARHLLDLDKYIPPVGNYHNLPSTAILSSRGCPFQCTYCGRTGTRVKNNVRFRSIENIIREINECIEKYKIYDFRFYDDTFVIPKKRLLEFCGELLKRKIKISWNCYSRVDTIDLEMLKVMKKAGCYHIKYGVEFGTENWLKKSKKGATLKQAREAIRNTKKAGIAAKASFMIGMPGETIEEIKETIKFAKELNPTYSTFGIFTPLPGSDLFNELKESGELLSDNYDNIFFKSTKVVKSQLDLDILKKLVKKAYFSTYFNYRFVLHRLVHLFRNFSFFEIRSLWQGLIILIK